MPVVPLLRPNRTPNIVPATERFALHEKAKHGLRLLGGGCALTIALLSTLALLTHATDDASWNTANTGAPLHNWLGLVGSYISDLFLQFFGIASFVVPVVLAAWGWRLIAEGKPKYLPLRAISALCAMMFFSLGLNGLPLVSLPSLAEGALGKILHAAFLSFLPLSWGAAALTVGAFIAAALTLYAALALPLDEWEALLSRIHARLAPLLTQITAPFQNLRRFWSAPNHVPDPLDTLRAETEDEPDEDKEETGTTALVVATPAPSKKKATASKKAIAIIPPPTDLALPPLSLLQWPESSKKPITISRETLTNNSKLLQKTLSDFGITGSIVDEKPGPVVTLYELEPEAGIRATRVITLAPDIARSMSALSARVAVVPGRNVIGIELPNTRRETVYLRELLEHPAYTESRVQLPLVLGKDIAGNPVIANLAKMPHLLVAGTTGSGKSVSINAMILSLLYCLPPDKCKMVMIDPKMVELSVYEDMPHLLTPVVTEPKKAVVALKWVVKKMEERNRDMSKVGAKNIDSYNQRIREAMKVGKVLTRDVQTGFDKETGGPIIEKLPIDLREWPYIVVIVDEMADLMQVAGKDIEFAIQRLAQMGRAAGIHLIAATQRPSVDVITGTIRSNFPARISFRVSSKIDSRTILNDQGAEQLLGQGDMLFANGGNVQRVHGPFVKEEEIEAVVKYLKAQGEPEYDPKVIEENEGGDGSDGAGGNYGGASSEDNSLYDRAVAVVLHDKKASVSYIQRRLGIGYNRAATLVERMEKEGLVGPDKGAGKRDIYGNTNSAA